LLNLTQEAALLSDNDMKTICADCPQGDDQVGSRASETNRRAAEARDGTGIDAEDTAPVTDGAQSTIADSIEDGVAWNVELLRGRRD
jgi:hypothetical protein